MSDQWSLEHFYDAYPQVEAEFDSFLDISLAPRPPEVLFDLVAGFSLPFGAAAVDVGCGEGRDAVQLATRFGLVVTGIDPVPRHLVLAREELGEASRERPELDERVQFQIGTAEAIPVKDESADLVWCRDVLVHVASLVDAYREFRRILRPGGRAVIYQMYGTDRLEPREASWLWSTMGVMPQSALPEHTDQAIEASGLRVLDLIDLTTEWGEWSQENTGGVARKLLHAARLIRDPDRYIAQFGSAAYNLMLGDCHWHIYAMIGKLTRRVYVLAR